MALSLEDKLRGASILELVTGISSINSDIYVNIVERDARGSYSLNVRKKSILSKSASFGLFLKSSNKRRSPWQYSFTKDHQMEIEHLRRSFDETFILFLNGEDGVACINYAQLKQVLDDNFEEVEGVRVSRKIRESYRINGRDGNLSRTLPRNSFPESIIDWIKTSL